MHPNEALRLMRAHAKSAHAVADRIERRRIWRRWPRWALLDMGVHLDFAVQYAMRLDRHLTQGGEPPDDWRR